MIAFTTAPTREEADAIAHALVGERLAACCTIVDRVTSVYRWEGTVESAAEWLVMIKTSEEALPRLESRLLELHSYDTPELLALPVAHGAEGYLRWMSGSIE